MNADDRFDRATLTSIPPQSEITDANGFVFWKNDDESFIAGAWPYVSLDGENEIDLTKINGPFTWRSINGDRGSSSDNGVWVVYSRDYNLLVQSIHAAEIDALRAINAQGYGSVMFVPFGVDVTDAAKADR